jgi:uncharacterized membrane protein YqaE (UPF0057 family)|tara:strand:+ start:480 stop:638 length:159 start_codon:yes stop_codon:yes gene_type:complete
MKILCLIFAPIGVFIGIVGLFTAGTTFEILVHLFALIMGLALFFSYYLLRSY